MTSTDSFEFSAATRPAEPAIQPPPPGVTPEPSPQTGKAPVEPKLVTDQPAPRPAPALTGPGTPILRMILFLILAGFLVFILQQQIWNAFLFNPGLNGLIAGVLVVGIVLALTAAGRLTREVRWVNARRSGTDGESNVKPPVLLAPMAALLGGSRSRPAISTATLRAILDSIAARLDESRDVLRYLTGLLVFLGLLGTFWGLIETVGSIEKVIGSMRTGGESGTLFEELKTGLMRPLSGMGISFSSSLFGLAGSLVLGFLDLQVGQAQNRFYNQLEEWLAPSASDVPGPGFAVAQPADLQPTLDRLQVTLGELATNRSATQAMANLADGIQALVAHMRNEQQLIRDWVEAQSDQQKALKRTLERLDGQLERRP